MTAINNLIGDLWDYADKQLEMSSSRDNFTFLIEPETVAGKDLYFPASVHFETHQASFSVHLSLTALLTRSY